MGRDLLTLLASTPLHLRRSVALDRVSRELEQVVGAGYSAAPPEPDQKLFEIGVSSLNLHDLRARLEVECGTELPIPLFFAHSSLAALADHLVSLVPDVDAPPASGHGGFAAGRQARLEARSAELERSRTEPIAIIGMSCRFAGGVEGPDSFWKLLIEGRSGIVGLPSARAELNACSSRDGGRPGSMYMSSGGFLDSVDGFDAEFFRISPREASQLDPQQRLFLEVAWRALEDAGLPVERLHGTRTAVMAGVLSNDYAHIGPPPAERIDAHYYSGVNTSFITGRLSYFLGLRGPSITVDTTCSSSLVAVHLACQSLRAGESELALAGGVNLILSPEVSLFLCKAGVISPSGACRAFDRGADGIVRGEGCGVVVLKRLGDALRDGDRVLAVVRGSAVNHDGASGGLTVPDPKAQAALYADALERAGLPGREVSYVEAHGTGTILGDPIELQGLSDGFCAGRPASDPLFVGSVKTNIGHTDSSAGIANLIKAVLILRNGEIPPSLNFAEPNENFAWERHPIQVAARRMPLPASDRPRVVGASSFGLSGINAHVLLEEFRGEPATPRRRPDRPHLLALSAKSPEALRELARDCARFLEAAPPDSLEALCSAALHRRSHHRERLAAVGQDCTDLRVALEEWLADETTDRVIRGRSLGEGPRKLAFLFSGQGGQWWAMGRELLQREPVFRRTLERIEGAFAPLAGWSLLEQLAAGEADSRIHDTEVAQPALFTLQVGLAELWRELGIVPDLVLGHSMGEVAAAHVAGALSLEEAVAVIHHRGSLLERSTGSGKMAATGLTPAEARELLSDYEGRVSVAAENGPRSVVLSGESGAMDEIARILEGRNVFHRELRVKFASHCPQMEAHQEELEQRLQGIRARTPSIPIVSTVTGGFAAPGDFGAAYWARNIRAPVLFETGMRALVEAGARTFLEVDPHPILETSIRQCLEAVGCEAVVAGSLQRERGDLVSWMESVGRLHVQGHPLPFHALYPDDRLRSDLPHHPWRRRRHWLKAADGATTGAAAGDAEPAGEVDPWVGTRLRSPLPAAQFQTRWSARTPRVLADHVVGGRPIVPGAAYLSAVLRAARTTGRPARALGHIAWSAPLVLGDEPVTVQLVLHPLDEGSLQRFEVFSCPASGSSWVLHASGDLLAGPGRSEDDAADLVGLRGRLGPRSVDGFYAELSQRGYDHRGEFRCIEELWSGEGEALAAFATRGGESALSPVLLDGFLHSVMAAVSDPGLFLPIGLDSLRIAALPQGRVFCHARLRPGPVGVEGGDALAADLRLLDGAGRTVGELEGLQLRRIEASTLAGVDRMQADACHAVAWKRRPIEEYVESGATSRPWLVFLDGGDVGRALLESLEAQGARPIVVRAGRELRLGEEFTVDPTRPEHMQQLLESIPSDRLAGASILWLWGLDFRDAEERSARELVELQEDNCGGVLHLVQALARRELEPQPHLWLVTRGAQPAGNAGAPGGAEASQAGLWGFGRVLPWEFPGLPCTLVDLDPAAGPQTDLLLQEIRFHDGEPFLAFRDGERRAARLGPLPLPPPTGPGLPTRLTLASYGSLSDLRLEPCRRRPPGADEVEIEVRACGLNFRDVLSALGMLEEYARERGVRSAAEMPFGHECSGIVRAVGARVTGLVPGDEVIAALAPGSLGSHVIARAAFVVQKPPELSFTDAATLPIAFLTAWYALHEVGRIRPGDRVLIHCATGGVGQAAVQLARRAGAEVFATASRGKWSVLEQVGVAHRHDSRSLEFADRIREETGGAGVDLVLNSLKGEFARRSLELVATGGRFVEIGKIDVLTTDEARALRPDVDYSLFDLETVGVEQPDRVGAVLADLVAAVSAGELTVLPCTDFAVDEAALAFRHMAQARHVGKVVLSRAATPDDARFTADGTYLVTGGLGGLGLRLARWLVEHGVRNLVLAGRRPPAPEAETLLAALSRRGARVRTVQMDVGSTEQVERTIEEITRTGPPLRGVFHAAVSLDDGIVLKQDLQRFRTVLHAKVAGTWNLHRATSELPLDSFVCFSSMVSVLGSAAQSNYAAASAVQDALVRRRRAQGLPGLVINWGPWAEVGRAAALGDREAERWLARGVRSIDPDAGLEILGRLLAQDGAQALVAPVDWSRYRERLPQPGLGRLLEELGGAAGGVERGLTLRLEGIEPGEARGLLETHVRKQIARVLSLPDPSRILPRQRLFEMGLDSLMAVELKNRLEQGIGRSLPSTVVFDHPTLEMLLGFLLELTGFAGAGASPRGADGADEFDDLDEDELAELLARELREAEDSAGR